MSFAFTHRKNVQAQVRDIARGQLRKALEEVAGPSQDAGKTLHSLRRRCKKLRGLVRLTRPHLKEADKENKAFREAAASLSQARDAAVMVETFAALLQSDQVDGRNVIPASEADDIAHFLEERAHQPGMQNDEQFARCREIFDAALQRVAHWSFSGRGVDVVADGFVMNYQQFRKRMAAAVDDPAPENLHDWRKVAKYHGHHLRLFGTAAPDIMRGSGELVDTLGDLLGDHHNLAVLAETLRKLGTADATLSAIKTQQERIAKAAFVLGHQLGAEEPKALRRRFESYWALLPEKT